MGAGKKIGEILKDQGRTAAWLAREIKIPPTTLRSMISNDSKIDAVILTDIAKALGCTVVDLLATGEKDGRPTFATGADFDAAHKSIVDKINAEDDAYIQKLRVPALKLNWRGRKLLLDQAELYTTFEMFTNINGNETEKED